MFLFRLKLYLKTIEGAWKAFGLSKELYLAAVQRPILTGLMRLFMTADHLFYWGIRRTEVRRPVIIIGHPRSGTTFLHRLLAETGDFCVFQTWEILVPSLVVRWLLKGLIARLIRQGKGNFFPKEVGHEGSLGQVEEEELLLVHNGNTQFVSCLSPLAFSDRDFAELVYADEQPPSVRRSAMAFLRACFQRQICSTGKTQIVAKMNYSGMPLRSLLEAFPDARVVYVARPPIETIPSHLTLHRNMFDHLWGLSRIPKERLDRYYQRRYRHNIAFYRYVEGLIRSGGVVRDRVMVLPYGDLRRDLAGSIRKVVDFTGIPLSPQLQARIDAQASQQESYQRKHTNLGLEEFGLSEERVLADFAFLATDGVSH